MQHAETTLEVFWNIYSTVGSSLADIKYDTEWCDYVWECCRIL